MSPFIKIAGNIKLVLSDKDNTLSEDEIDFLRHIGICALALDMATLEDRTWCENVFFLADKIMYFLKTTAVSNRESDSFKDLHIALMGLDNLVWENRGLLDIYNGRVKRSQEIEDAYTTYKEKQKAYQEHKHG